MTQKERKEAAQHPVGVIDIGSNSVRLVIYDGIKLSAMPIFNEKVLCGLAIGMSDTGKLHSEGVKAAHACIGRFITLAKVMKVKNLYLFGTSAVRDASDGMEFIKKIECDYGYSVEVLTGEEEAKYSGLGIISSMSHANGVVADLGGGSLELIGIKDGHLLRDAVSYPIGPLRMSGDRRKTVAYQRLVKDALTTFNFKLYHGQSLYLVGGAFRSLAKIHMARKHYPLKVIHNYAADADDFSVTLSLVKKMSGEVVKGIPHIPDKRAKFLPFAAMVANQMIEDGQPKSIVFSACGVREGLLFSKLTAHEKQKDALIGGCINLAKAIGREPEYGFELAEWLEPLIKNVEEDKKRLILAACILSDISCYENAEYRAEMAYRRVMDSSLMAINHRERAYISQMLYYRYDAGKDGLLAEPTIFLLKKDELRQVKILGGAMRLARSLSGSHVGILPHIPLSITKDKVVITFKKGYQLLYGEKIAKRLSQMAEILNVKPVVRK